MRWQTGVASVLVFTGQLIWAAPAPEVLDIYADAYSPFIQQTAKNLRGPYIEAFDQLVRQQGITVRFLPMPVKRLMQVLADQPNSCGLAVNFAAAEAERLHYVARVAPITLAVYALESRHIPPLTNIEALHGYRIGAIDVAELNELLDNAAIRYEPLAKAGSGVPMLQAGRFDLLISDVFPDLIASDQDSPKMSRVMVLARVERWLACNASVPPDTINALRRAMHAGVFADSVAGIWQQYGLQAVYDQVRREWAPSEP